MKVVIAAMRHETNTFSPVATPLRSFIARFDKSLADEGGLLDGDRAIEMFEHTNTPFAAFVKAAREHDADMVVPVYANASPSAPTDRASFDQMSQAIVDAIKSGCDAALLDLHGAMVVEGIDDAEAELLSRIRAIAPDLPIAIALDFHANLSDAFFDAADIVTGYCTYPHVDTFETGERAARSLFAWVAGGSKPSLCYRRLPMMTHMNAHSPSFEPMKSIMNRAMSAEAAGEVQNASVFGGFPLCDVPHAGLLVVIVADDQATGNQLADELASMAWQRRADFVFHAEPYQDTIKKAKALDAYPVVIADHGNNCASGGSADTMAVIEEILRQQLDSVIAGPVCDPDTVGACIGVGVGNEITLDVGGKTDMPTVGLKGQPLNVSGRVRTITDGKFVITGPMFTGVQVDMGRTVVIDLGSMQLVVSEDRVEPFDLGVFTHCGLDPLQANYICLQSRQHFRAGFESIAKHILLAAGPGVCISDYDQLAFEQVRRPMFPLDNDTAWP